MRHFDRKGCLTNHGGGVSLREKQGGVENSGDGKYIIKPLPKTVLDPPPQMIRFAPLFVHALSFLEGTGTDQIPLSELSKTGFGGRALWYFFPQKTHDTFFLCPRLPFPNSLNFRVGFWQNGLLADFYFRAAGFFSRILSADFFSSFLWGKSAQKNPPVKSLTKSSKIINTTKIPTHVCRWVGPISSFVSFRRSG